MPIQWTQQELQRHIDECVEENLNLDYKAADALAKTDGKKSEITKDVSAMANSAGGIIIYGIREHSDAAKKHLPAAIDPLDRTQISKEWVEQIINNIQPRVNGIIIHPVELNAPSNQVAYIVEIPQSTTAHQAKDFRYYKRFNFESVPMSDYEVRDVMHRRTLPDLVVEFGYQKSFIETPDKTLYVLSIKAKNIGVVGIERFKLHIIFPIYDKERGRVDFSRKLASRWGLFSLTSFENRYELMVSASNYIFPNDEVDIGKIFRIQYYMNIYAYRRLKSDIKEGNERKLEWTLYADNMPPKTGEVSLTTLVDY